MAVLFVAAFAAHGGTINRSGTFTTDDERATIFYTVANQGPVTVSTTSFATGGFSPILSLFDSTGNFLFLDSGYANNTDATLSWVSNAGAFYTIVLTEFDNFPVLLPTGTLSDGFTEDGQGNFTETLSGMTGPFHLPTGEQLTGDWAISFTSPDPSLQVSAPEPGTGLMLLPVLLLGLYWKRGSRASSPQSN